MRGRCLLVSSSALGLLLLLASLSRVRRYDARVRALPSAPDPAGRAGGSSAAYRECALDCGNFTCNRMLGECACPPDRGGARCAELLFDACAVQWNFSLADSPDLCARARSAAPAWPVTCECAAQCEAGVGYTGYELCVDARPPSAAPPRHTFRERSRPVVLFEPEIVERVRAAARGSLARAECSGRGLLMAPLPPFELMRKVRRLERLAAGAAAKRAARANRTLGRGRRAPRPLPTPPALELPALGAAACHCVPGWHGPRCERREKRRFCLNGCSRRGACVHGVCACEPGWWGIDCALGASSVADGTGEAHEARARASGRAPSPRVFVYELPGRFNAWLARNHYTQPWAFKTFYSADVELLSRLTASPHRTLAPAAADFFFIPACLSLGAYELGWGPGDLMPAGMAAIEDVLGFVNGTWPWYAAAGGADHALALTSDRGAEAWREKLAGSAAEVVAAWRERAAHGEGPGGGGGGGGAAASGRSRGAASGGDDGMEALRTSLAAWARRRRAALPRVAVLSHHTETRVCTREVCGAAPLPEEANRWGARVAAAVDEARAHAAPPFVRGRDLALAPQPDLDTIGWERGAKCRQFRCPAAAERLPARPGPLLFWRGKVLSRVPAYSRNVRQRASTALGGGAGAAPNGSARGAVVVSSAKGEYEHLLRAASFCLAPLGHGWAHYLVEAVGNGCIPVLVADDNDAPFEPWLPLDAYGVRVPEAQIAALPQLLRAIPTAEVERRRRALACLWPRFVFLSLDHSGDGVPDLPEACVALRARDAAATALEVLRARALARAENRTAGDDGAGRGAGAAARAVPPAEVVHRHFPELRDHWPPRLRAADAR